MSRLRTDHKLAAHLINAFLHSDQAKPLVFFLRIKSATIVRQLQPNPSGIEA